MNDFDGFQTASTKLMSQATDILAQDHNSLAVLAGKTFLVTGGEGMLGRAFGKQIERYVPHAKVHCPGRAQLNVQDPAAFKLWMALRPDFVIHCAALVDADYCEDHESEARDAIVAGTSNVGAFSKNCGAVLVYPQSFLIFDSADTHIDETSLPNPLGVYGRLKLEAEQIALQSDSHTLSIRMAGFFGGEAADNNFVGRITPHLAKLIRQGDARIEIGNRIWQPTYTDDLAANCLLLLAKQCSGIYCMSSHGAASFHSLTLEIARILGISDKVRIDCVDAALLAKKEKSLRPLSVVMSNSRLTAEGLDRQRNWQPALTEYLNQSFFTDLFR